MPDAFTKYCPSAQTVYTSHTGVITIILISVYLILKHDSSLISSCIFLKTIKNGISFHTFIVHLYHSLCELSRVVLVV